MGKALREEVSRTALGVVGTLITAAILGAYAWIWSTTSEMGAMSTDIAVIKRDISHIDEKIDGLIENGKEH